MAKVRLDVCMEREMKHSIKKIVEEGVRYRDLSHFVIVACDKLINEEQVQQSR